MSKEKVKNIIFPFIPLVILGLDIWSKYLVQKNLPLHIPVKVLGNFFRFTFVYNKGITFGMFNQANSPLAPVILTLLALVALGVVIYFYLNLHRFLKPGRPQIWGRLSLMFIVGGALGNILDRLWLFNRDGVKAVVDFIDMGIGNHRWYTYNVADSFVVVGAIILAVLFFFFELKEVKEKKDETADKDENKEENKKEA